MLPGRERVATGTFGAMGGGVMSSLGLGVLIGLGAVLVIAPRARKRRSLNPESDLHVDSVRPGIDGGYGQWIVYRFSSSPACKLVYGSIEAVPGRHLYHAMPAEGPGRLVKSLRQAIDYIEEEQLDPGTAPYEIVRGAMLRGRATIPPVMAGP